MNNTTETKTKKAGRPAGKTNKPATVRVPLSLLVAHLKPEHNIPVKREYLMEFLGLTEEQLDELTPGIPMDTLIAANYIEIEADEEFDTSFITRRMPEVDDE